MQAVDVESPESRQVRAAREQRVVSRSLQKLLKPGPRFQLTTDADPQRAAVEAFIARKFLEYHDAQVTAFLPVLLSIWCRDRHTAALGIKPASLGPLFLEQYLDRPAEQVIAEVTRTPTSRAGIVEVGNLVSTLNGATALLYLILLATVHRGGFSWVVFTASPEVRRGIERLGFMITPVCRADPSRLANREQWGSYYDSVPEVMVGHVAASHAACLENRLLEAVLALTETKVAELANGLVALS